MRPVKLPVLRIGHPFADSSPATWAARCWRRELLSTVTGSLAASTLAGVCVAGGSLTGGAAGEDDWAGDGLDEVADAAGDVDDVAGCSATAPGAGPLADGRLLSTSRMRTTAMTAVTAASGGIALRINCDAGLAAR